MMIFHRNNRSASIPPCLDRSESDEEKRRRVSTLSASEHEVYQWVRKGFSRRWIAETLLLNRSEIKVLERQICTKLKVESRRGIVRFYGVLDQEVPLSDLPDQPPMINPSRVEQPNGEILSSPPKQPDTKIS